MGESGLYGTALPVFASDRLARPGESVYITGLGAAATADLFIQSGDSAGATVTVQILDAQGEILETIQEVPLAGWDSAELENVAPSDAATAVVLNDPSSGGPITAWAMLWMGEAREIGVDDLHDLVVDFVVVEGEGAVLVITESIENGTGDVLIRFD